MKKPSTARELGQAGLALIIVIAWALTAVVMLTRTLVSAEQIDRKVNSITGNLHEVERETDVVSELVKTEKTSAAILEAAKPLTGMLKVVDDAAKNIDSTAKRIDPNAKSINSTVVSINGHVANILSTARSIENTLKTITGQAVNIRQTVDTIKTDTRNIQIQTNGTNGIRAHTCAIVLSGCTGPAPS
jgi:nicotinate-nucleotide pyrophosphorylase